MKFDFSFLSFMLLVQFGLAFSISFLPIKLKFRRILWGSVAFLSLIILGIRWHAVAYPPMRNVFEAFLWIPLLLVLSTALTYIKAKIDATRFDAFIGSLFLFPMVFIFSHAVKPLMPALQSPFFVPHILGYMIAYTLLMRSFVLLCVARWKQRSEFMVAANISFVWGFFFLTLALALGSIWGNEVWGAYWQWDPKEQWSMATWLIYIAALHFPKHSKARFILLGLGILFILLTLTWSNVLPNILASFGLSENYLNFIFPRGMHAYA